jgi:hypothetical protein
LRLPHVDGSSAGFVNAWTRSGRLPWVDLLHVLTLPDFERADRIEEFWGYPESRTFGELLIDCEEDQTLRAGWLDATGG